MGGAVGVLLGGMLTEWAGWEWVLFVNVPIGIAAAVFTRATCARAARPSAGSGTSTRSAR
jgi:MFS family permease